MANVDVCFIVVAAEPQADLYLTDKVLINCFQEGIEPVIVVNKSDLSNSVFDEVRSNYGDIADIISTSAMDEGSVVQIRKYLQGKTACFAGQSAVGKTSLVNALLAETVGLVGGLSAKTGRGRHTTRHAVLLKSTAVLLRIRAGFRCASFTVYARTNCACIWTISCGCPSDAGILPVRIPPSPIAR